MAHLCVPDMGRCMAAAAQLRGCTACILAMCMLSSTLMLGSLLVSCANQVSDA